jgi:hypothetical protein
MCLYIKNSDKKAYRHRARASVGDDGWRKVADDWYFDSKVLDKEFRQVGSQFRVISMHDGKLAILARRMAIDHNLFNPGNGFRESPFLGVLFDDAILQGEDRFNLQRISHQSGSATNASPTGQILQSRNQEVNPTSFGKSGYSPADGINLFTCGGLFRCFTHDHPQRAGNQFGVDHPDIKLRKIQFCCLSGADCTA